MAVGDRENPPTPLAASSSPPPNVVTFSPIKSPSPRRLSSHFLKPNRPLQFKPQFRSRSASEPAQHLAWISLQGRLVGAEEASSSRTIGDGLFGRDEAIAWELFSPMHRILIVAVVAVATANSEKNRQIQQLRERVRVRDEMLSSLQQKFDHLLEEVDDGKKRQLEEAMPDSSISKSAVISSREALESSKSDLACGDCWLREQHRAQSNGLLVNSTSKVYCSDQIVKYPTPLLNGAEQEERRLSDLSDWASTSAASAVDILLNNLAIEEDIYNAKREAEEKDAAIEELSAFILSKEKATSKRIEELEDIIRRKNAIITRQRKDIAALEQKVFELSRPNRSSFSHSISRCEHRPMMVDNILFGMDSTTSSSSDSDRSPGKRKKTTSIETEEGAMAYKETSNDSSLTLVLSSHRRQISAPPANFTSSGKRQKASTIDREDSEASQDSSGGSSLALGTDRAFSNIRQMSAGDTCLSSISGRPYSDRNQRSERSPAVNPHLEKSTVIRPITASMRTKQPSVTMEKSTSETPCTASSRWEQRSSSGEMKNGRRVGSQKAFQRKRWA